MGGYPAFPRTPAGPLPAYNWKLPFGQPLACDAAESLSSNIGGQAIDLADGSLVRAVISAANKNPRRWMVRISACRLPVWPMAWRAELIRLFKEIIEFKH
jgi:hypothetical protein